MLRIFINTWGNYNVNGADGGEWLQLPCDDIESELDAIAERIGDDDPEFTIHDYEWETDVAPREISEYEDISELNEYIEALDNLQDWELETYLAACEIWGGEYVDLDDLDEYNLYTDIEDEYDLGYYWAVESGCYDLEKMGSLANYIDYSSFGRDIYYESDGGFSSYGYIERI